MNCSKLIRAFCSVVLFCGYNLFAQTYQKLERYVKDNDQTYITSEILIDRDGIVWYTTQNGIYKDYGSSKHFIPLKFSSNTSTGIIFDLYQDAQNNIWVGCDNGAYIITPYSLNVKQLVWKSEGGLQNVGFTAFINQDATTVLIGTNNAQILKYDINSGTIKYVGTTKMERFGKWMKFIKNFDNDIIVFDDKSPNRISSKWYNDDIYVIPEEKRNMIKHIDVDIDQKKENFLDSIHHQNLSGFKYYIYCLCTM